MVSEVARGKVIAGVRDFTFGLLFAILSDVRRTRVAEVSGSASPSGWVSQDEREINVESHMLCLASIPGDNSTGRRTHVLAAWQLLAKGHGDGVCVGVDLLCSASAAGEIVGVCVIIEDTGKRGRHFSIWELTHAGIRIRRTSHYSSV